MNSSSKSLIAASVVKLLSNSAGTVIPLGQNLPADWGGSLKGQDV